MVLGRAELIWYLCASSPQPLNYAGVVARELPVLLIEERRRTAERACVATGPRRGRAMRERFHRTKAFCHPASPRADWPDRDRNSPKDSWHIRLVVLVSIAIQKPAFQQETTIYERRTRLAAQLMSRFSIRRTPVTHDGGCAVSIELTRCILSLRL